MGWQVFAGFIVSAVLSVISVGVCLSNIVVHLMFLILGFVPWLSPYIGGKMAEDY
jgi:hypothetical protein